MIEPEANEFQGSLENPNLPKTFLNIKYNK
jgi:hypothetical protein